MNDHMSILNFKKSSLQSIFFIMTLFLHRSILSERRECVETFKETERCDLSPVWPFELTRKPTTENHVNITILKKKNLN